MVSGSNCSHRIPTSREGQFAIGDPRDAKGAVSVMRPLSNLCQDVVEVPGGYWYTSRLRAPSSGVGGGRPSRRKGQYVSLHKSLLAGRRAGRHRNVLSREERIAKLEDEGRWNEDGSSVFGLPKVRSIKPVAGKKAKKKEEEAAAAEPGAEGVAEGAEGAEAAPAEGEK